MLRCKCGFLARRRLGVPVSPFLDTSQAKDLVIKHRNEEGGMGIFFYKNATEGGNWIIQERIHNSDFVNSMLPPNAPLSTFRIITMSRSSLNLNERDLEIKKSDSHDSRDSDYGHNNIDGDGEEDKVGSGIKALSCVFRAGRENAPTDHDSVLFDVDIDTGLVGKGSTNSNWYKIGLHHILSCPWRTNDEDQRISHHPDSGKSKSVTGRKIEQISSMVKLVEESHRKMCPDVPFVGWDVVLSNDEEVPMCLLEVNLSCNFFRGSFNEKEYFSFIDEMFTELGTKMAAKNK